jgi:hypothetical protein
MTDSEIATKLAQAMGWRLIPESKRMMGYREHWAEPAEGCEFNAPNPNYCSIHGKVHYIESVRQWDPATSWDHVGIVVVWASEKFPHWALAHQVADMGPLEPLTICKAVLHLLEW